MSSPAHNPFADLLGLNEEETASIFGPGLQDMPPGPAPSRPATQIVVVRFNTEEQRAKASRQILDTGMLRVRVPID